MSYGVVIKSSNGSVLASAEAKAYSLYETIYAFTNAGRERVYDSSCPSYPIVYLHPAVGSAAGVLSIEGAPGNWSIRVLATGGCYLRVYRPIPNGRSTGFGVEFFNAGGDRTYSSNEVIANPRLITTFNVGSVINVASPEFVSYYSTPVRYEQSSSERHEYAGTTTILEYIQTIEYVCQPESVYTCGTQYQTSYQCGIDPFSGYYSCSPVTAPVYTCWFEMQTVCSWRPVWSWQPIIHHITAVVRRTNWSIERGGAAIGANSVSFVWILHDAGYYDEVIGGFDSASNYSGAQINSMFNLSSMAFLMQEGQFSATNRFPYTTTSVNQINATIAVE